MFLDVTKSINITYNEWKRNVILPLLQQGDRAEQPLPIYGVFVGHGKVLFLSQRLESLF